MSSRIYARGDSRQADRIEWTRLEGESDSGVDYPRTRLAEIEQDAERRVREARQAGFDEGAAAARAEAAAEIRSISERVAATLAELVGLRPLLPREAEADLLKLALAIARRILHRELAIDPDAMRGLIQAALEKLQAQEVSRVRVHPSQEPLLRSLLDRYPQARQVEFRADPALDRGAAVFETPRGNLDASVETQLREIGQGLADRLRGQL
jgi:flagellar assembly protein FliH